MPDTVDSREEQQLLDAVKTATDLVAKGKTPDEAVEKVARDNGFGPGKIRLIGQAYNNGQQLAQWRQPGNVSILDKVASFELCDPQRVIDNRHCGSLASGCCSGAARWKASIWRSAASMRTMLGYFVRSIWG